MTNSQMMKLVNISDQIINMILDFGIIRDSFYDWTEKEDVYDFCKKLVRVRLLRTGLIVTFEDEGFSKDLDPIYSEMLDELQNDLDEMDKELLALCKKYGTKKEEEP